MNKQDLFLSKPLLNAPGFLGFTPNPRALEVMAQFEDWGGFGAFVTDPISWRSRSPAANAVYTQTDGQVLLHNGWPNRGFRAVLKAVASKWAHAPLPIIPSLLECDPEQALVMVRALEGMENLAGVNIMPALDSLSEVKTWLAAIAVFNAEFPIAVTLPAGIIPMFGRSFAEAGASALFQAPARGVIHRDGGFISGRLYGPSQYPCTLALAMDCSKLGVPLIAAGGVDSAEKARDLLAEHAIACVIDIPLWQ